MARRLISINRIKVIAKTNRLVDDASVAYVSHCNFRVIGKSWCHDVVICQLSTTITSVVVLKLCSRHSELFHRCDFELENIWCLDVVICQLSTTITSVVVLKLRCRHSELFHRCDLELS